MRDDVLYQRLTGTPPYDMYHPRLIQHPGPVVVLGCLNWDPYCHEMRRHKKRLIGVDPATTVDIPGVEHLNAVVTPFRGELDFYQEGGGASLLWHHRPMKARRVKSITMADVLDFAGAKDLAALKMNIEGPEFFILLTMKRPYADQITVAFHDRLGNDPALPTARDAVIAHLDQWYDYCRLTAYTLNDWWFFLRKETA